MVLSCIDLFSFQEVVLVSFLLRQKGVLLLIVISYIYMITEEPDFSVGGKSLSGLTPNFSVVYWLFFCHYSIPIFTEVLLRIVWLFRFVSSPSIHFRKYLPDTSTRQLVACNCANYFKIWFFDRYIFCYLINQG